MTEVYVVVAAPSPDLVHRVIAVCERSHEATNEASAWMLARGGIGWERTVTPASDDRPACEGWFLEGAGWVGIQRWPVIPSGERSAE